MVVAEANYAAVPSRPLPVPLLLTKPVNNRVTASCNKLLSQYKRAELDKMANIATEAHSRRLLDEGDRKLELMHNTDYADGENERPLSNRRRVPKVPSHEPKRKRRSVAQKKADDLIEARRLIASEDGRQEDDETSELEGVNTHTHTHTLTHSCAEDSEIKGA
jgi:hypothetical protein